MAVGKMELSTLYKGFLSFNNDFSASKMKRPLLKDNVVKDFQSKLDKLKKVAEEFCSLHSALSIQDRVLIQKTIQGFDRKIQNVIEKNALYFKQENQTFSRVKDPFFVKNEFPGFLSYSKLVRVAKLFEVAEDKEQELQAHKEFEIWMYDYPVHRMNIFMLLLDHLREGRNPKNAKEAFLGGINSCYKDPAHATSKEKARAINQYLPKLKEKINESLQISQELCKKCMVLSDVLKEIDRETQIMTLIHQECIKLLGIHGTKQEIKSFKPFMSAQDHQELLDHYIDKYSSLRFFLADMASQLKCNSQFEKMITLFRQQNQTQAIKIFTEMDLENCWPEVVWKIYHALWEFEGKPLKHPDFGRAAFHNRQGVKSSCENKAKALERVKPLYEKVSSRLMSSTYELSIIYRVCGKDYSPDKKIMEAFDCLVEDLLQLFHRKKPFVFSKKATVSGVYQDYFERYPSLRPCLEVLYQETVKAYANLKMPGIA